MKIIFWFLTCLFALLYRPINGTRSWAILGIFDTRAEAIEQQNGPWEGAPAEFKIVRIFE